jgi:hypothetical protein
MNLFANPTYDTDTGRSVGPCRSYPIIYYFYDRLGQALSRKSKNFLFFCFVRLTISIFGLESLVEADG